MVIVNVLSLIIFIHLFLLYDSRTRGFKLFMSPKNFMFRIREKITKCLTLLLWIRIRVWSLSFCDRLWHEIHWGCIPNCVLNTINFLAKGVLRICMFNLALGIIFIDDRYHITIKTSWGDGLASSWSDKVVSDKDSKKTIRLLSHQVIKVNKLRELSSFGRALFYLLCLCFNNIYI